MATHVFECIDTRESGLFVSWGRFDSSAVRLGAPVRTLSALKLRARSPGPVQHVSRTINTPDFGNFPAVVMAVSGIYLQL